MNILVVEDNQELAEFLKFVLEEKGNKVVVCDSVEEVIGNGYEKLSHDLIILDLMLKGKRGENLIRELKKNKSNIPILVLSALGDTHTKVQMINLGADDYLTKPFNTDELLARLKALYRRYLQTGVQDREKFKDFTFFRKQNRLLREGKNIFLTSKESEVFEMLLRNRNKVVPLADLLRIWDAEPGYHSNIVQSVVRRLRKKVDFGFDTKLVQTKHGIGYALIIEE
ncbi:MAG: response regulator transcription factor [Candidatus Altimarinota bacterium]